MVPDKVFSHCTLQELAKKIIYSRLKMATLKLMHPCFGRYNTDTKNHELSDRNNLKQTYQPCRLLTS